MTSPWAGTSSDRGATPGAGAGADAPAARRSASTVRAGALAAEPRRPARQARGLLPRFPSLSIPALACLSAAALSVVLAAILASGGCSSGRLGYVYASASWPTECGDFCRTGTLGAEVHPPLTLKWTAKAGRAPLGPLAVLEDAVAGCFARRTVAMYALDSGEALWKRSLRTDPSSGPSAADGMMFVSTNIPEGKTYCLSLQDGKTLWSIDTGEAAGPSSAASPFLFMCTRSGSLLRLGMADGAIHWSRRIARLTGCSPGLAGERAVMTTLGDSVVAVSRASGEPLWGYDAGGAQFGSPAVCEDHCIVSTSDGYAICLDLRSGTELWRKQLGGRCMSSPAVKAGLAYFTDLGGRVSCFRASTGEAVWDKTLDSPVRAGPTVTSYYVFTADLSGLVSCFDRNTGELLWSENLGEPFEHPAVVAELYLVLASTKGTIYCFKEDVS